jgi:flagellar hook assembly protein FlgD
MGEWDGSLNNGEEAISGVYVFVVTYYIPNEHQLQTESGNIVLVR